MTEPYPKGLPAICYELDAVNSEGLTCQYQSHTPVQDETGRRVFSNVLRPSIGHIIDIKKLKWREV